MAEEMLKKFREAAAKVVMVPLLPDLRVYVLKGEWLKESHAEGSDDSRGVTYFTSSSSVEGAARVNW